MTRDPRAEELLREALPVLVRIVNAWLRERGLVEWSLNKANEEPTNHLGTLPNRIRAYLAEPKGEPEWVLRARVDNGQVLGPFRNLRELERG